MTRSRVRSAVSIGLLLIVCAVLGYQLKSSSWPDNTCEASLSRLQSYWPSSRRSAASSLAQYVGEGDKVVPALVKSLGDADIEVRINSLESLKAFGEKPKAAGPILKAMLEHDPDVRIRKAAAGVLGSIKDQNAVPALIGALDSQDSSVRLEATRALGRFGPAINTASLVEKLITGLSPELSDEQRDASVLALESIAPDQERVARALAQVLAKDPSPTVRNHALSLMARRSFGFEIEALVAALDDASPEVKLTAGSHLASIGVSDDRVVPALCKAARRADDVTREGVGINLERLALNNDVPEDKLAESYRSAVRELASVLETRGAAGRPQIVTVLTRLISYYQKTGKNALLEPAKAAVAALLSRVTDETEDVPLRLDCMNQLGLIQVEPAGSSRGVAPAPAVAVAAHDELHPGASWIVALGGLLKSAVGKIRSRAVEILRDSFNHPQADLVYAESWRKIVPLLAEAARDSETRTRNAAWTLLGLLGPEAAGALGELRILASQAQDDAINKSARAAISSIESLEKLKANDPAARIAAAEALSRLDWCATPGIPALIDALKDHEPEVRAAAARALSKLGASSKAAVQPLLTALPGEPEATARAAFLEALEAIAPGNSAVLDAHRNALHDADSQVRKTAVTFGKVPADDSWVSALGSALGDPAESVRQAASHSLVSILFEHPRVIPTLVKALGDDKELKTVQAALDQHFEKTSDAAEFDLVHEDAARLQVTLGAAIPALREALTSLPGEIVLRVFSLLGRIVAFSRLSRNAELQKAAEPALETYLQGLNHSSPAVHHEVLARLDATPIRRPDIAAALIKYLERSDLSDENRQTAATALAAQAAFADSTPGLHDALTPGITVLARALQSPNAWVRDAAVRSLGHIGSEARSAGETLHRLVKNDPYPRIRKDAEDSIKAINGIAKMPAPVRSGGRM